MTLSKTTATCNSSRIVLALILAVLLCGLILISPAASPEVSASTSEVQGDLDWGRMPLYFIANEGRLDDAVAYYVQGADKTLYLTSEGLVFLLSAPAEGGEAGTPAPRDHWVVKLDYPGAHAVAPQGQEQTEAVISYFRGAPEDWNTGVPTYSSVAYEGLWEGVDLLYSGTQDQLKQEFILAPGADPDQIRLSYQGAALSLNDQGELEVSTPVGGFTDEAPVAYQEVAGERVEVEVAYSVGDPSGSGAQETTSYGFTLGDYDPSLSLVIDPAIIVYCGFIGGAGGEVGRDIAVVTSGCAYVTGDTESLQTSFPLGAGPDFTHNGGTDAFVAKVNETGTGLYYCGYIGGSGTDQGYGIAVDSAGCAYVTGSTYSTQTSFPVTVGPDLTHNGGVFDAFVAKVSTDGTALLYCGYIGGSGFDYGEDIVLASGYAYVIGNTSSTQTSFPVAVGPDLTHNGGYDAFVARVSSTGSLVACGYIGGSGTDKGYGIAADSSGSIYVTGNTNSTETTFPETTGSLDTTYNGGYYDAFVAKMGGTLASLTYCGYIGGSGIDQGYGIATDGIYAYVTGSTDSTESSFPVVGGPDLTFNGLTDAFVARVNTAGSALVYCTYIGGSENEAGQDIAMWPGTSSAYITGGTRSDQYTFPVTAGPDMVFNGASDAFVARMSASGTTLQYCGYIGGSQNDGGHGIAVSSSGAPYVVGVTSSTEATFPVAGGPDLSHNGGQDVFVARLVWSSVTIDELMLYKRSTGLRKTMEVYEDGTSEKISKGTWTKKCNQVVPVEIDGDAKSEVLIYKKSNGRAIFADLSGVGAPTTILSTIWTGNWTHMIAVEVDGTAGSELFLYDSTGLLKVLDVDASGATTTLNSGTWTSGWTHVIPVEIDGTSRSEVLVYNKGTGSATLLDISAAGVPTTILATTWAGAWTRIVPVELDGDGSTELFLYDSSGSYKAVNVASNGVTTELSSGSWGSGWKTLVAIDIDADVRSELLVYKKKNGRAVFFDLSAAGVPTEISRTRWTKKLSHIVTVVTAET